MEIKVNLDALVQHYITPDDYVFLWGLFTGYDLTAMEMYPNYQQLEEKGFIKIGEDYILTEQGRKLFEPQGLDQKFLEFWTTYPFRSGQRVLRDKNSDTKQAGVCKRKYELILNRNPYIHSTIMKGLINYIKSTDNRYFVGIEVFLNQEYWNKYADTDTDIKETGTTQSI